MDAKCNTSAAAAAAALPLDAVSKTSCVQVLCGGQRCASLRPDDTTRCFFSFSSFGLNLPKHYRW